MALESSMAPINLSKHDRVEVSDGHVTCMVEAADRPRWGLEWARDRQGLYALAPTPSGSPQRVSHHLLTAAIPGVVVKLHEPSGERRGRVDRFTLNLDAAGLVAGLAFQPGITQSFRYLPPGQFLMGSPHNEPSRFSDEGPLHAVILTEGLWLADTACTQALWLAVMGDKNPRRFTGDADLPVERVSWDDVQIFLTKLQAYLPTSVEAVLPTEAQWEYACRAGSSTPFSFGDQISTEQVNYNGNYPYTNGPKREYRGKTVPVKALLANAWGFYQMHGNVLEWCADAMRKYTGATVTNPSGASGNGTNAYAVRGGSWSGYARHARSALRLQAERIAPIDDIGFRFAIRPRRAPGAAGPTFDGRRPLHDRDGPDFGGAAHNAAPVDTREEIGTEVVRGMDLFSDLTHKRKR
jgi:formylglycine-generating enzyme required for sulfatase activity